MESEEEAGQKCHEGGSLGSQSHLISELLGCVSHSEHNTLLSNSRLEGNFPMCMGHDGRPQVIHISIAVKADSSEGMEKSKSLA